MLRVPERVGRKFGVWLVREGVPSGAHGRYRKWLRYYLDFCHKYGYGYLGEGSLDGFRGKLESKHQSPAQVREAEAAVRVYFWMAGSGAVIGVDDRGALAIRGDGGRQGSAEGWGRVEPTVLGGATGPQERGTSWQAQFKALADAIQLRHYSRKTLQSYRLWVRKFQTFTGSKAPDALSAEDVKAFLTDLAVAQGVAASTQNQAFNALLLLPFAPLTPAPCAGRLACGSTLPSCAGQRVREVGRGRARQTAPLHSGGAEPRSTGLWRTWSRRTTWRRG